jgi:hypothetical protein
MLFDDDPAGGHLSAVRDCLVAVEGAGHRVVSVKNFWPSLCRMIISFIF